MTAFRSLAWALDWLLPEACRLCGLAGGDVRGLCPRCWRALPWLPGVHCPRCAVPLPGGGVCGRCLREPPPVEATRAALLYQDDARELVHAFKYDGDLVAGRILALALIRKVNVHFFNAALIPACSTPRRIRQRGFDPAVEIARMLARTGAFSLRLDALRRMDARRSQTAMSSRRRRSDNVQGVFHVKPGAVMPLVVLVDDVLTTGATTDAAARALRRAGARVVHRWVAVRTP